MKIPQWREPRDLLPVPPRPPIGQPLPPHRPEDAPDEGILRYWRRWAQPARAARMADKSRREREEHDELVRQMGGSVNGD